MQITVPEGYILITKVDYEQLLNRLEMQEARIKELEGMIHKDSHNSHKPPGSDGLRKPIKNNRERSNRKAGGQVGHEGNTLEMVEKPDKVIRHKVKGRCECGEDLENMAVKEVQRKQVFDLPEKLYEVTEHQIEVKQCKCGRIHKAECPVNGVTQYGDRMKGLLVYLNQYQFLPNERLQEFMHDIFSLPLGGGTIETSQEKCHEQLEETEQQIKKGLLESAVIHNDETGMRCKVKAQWVHTTSSKQYTHYSMQEKRGKEAMDAIGILPQYKGNSVHDRWSSYDNYSCTHSHCNAHLLRELKFVYEELGKKWARKMIEFLVLALYMKNRDWLNERAIASLMKRYQQILALGITEEDNFISSEPTKKRGRKAKPKSLRLLEVFMNRREQVLRFVHNKDTPFDNNLAERDLRMIKLKQKISGCFRTQHGADVFCRIRGYISTVRKQGHSVLYAIEQALRGNPIRVYQPC